MKILEGSDGHLYFWDELPFLDKLWFLITNPKELFLRLIGKSEIL